MACFNQPPAAALRRARARRAARGPAALRLDRPAVAPSAEKRPPVPPARGAARPAPPCRRRWGRLRRCAPVLTFVEATRESAAAVPLGDGAQYTVSMTASGPLVRQTAPAPEDGAERR